MFPYEDSKTVSVCPYPKRNPPGFIIISLTVVIEILMERSSRDYSMKIQKFDFLLKKGRN